MNDRIAKLKAHIEALEDEGVRRTTFFDLTAESLRANADAPHPIRRARAIAHLFDNAAILIHPHELVAGSILSTWPILETPTYDERQREAVRVLEDYLAGKAELPSSRTKPAHYTLISRDHGDGNIAYTDLQRLIADMSTHFAEATIEEHEIARELLDHFEHDYGEAGQLVNSLPWTTANHLDLNYRDLVQKGLGAIREEIRSKPETEFYRTAAITIDAVIRHFERYAQLALEESRKHLDDEARMNELLDMAAILKKVSTQKPGTFREALQLVWLVHVMGNMQRAGALSFARFDQYMRPFYEADLAAGRMTRDEIKELLSCMWLKVNEPHMLTVESLCLAGTTPDGKDAASDLTRLCLETCRDLRQPYPNVSVRLSKRSPDWLYHEIAQTVKAGIGQPMVLNDERWIPNLERLDYPTEAARDYYNMGCVEIMIQGGGAPWAGGCGPTDFPAAIELVFTNGAETRGGLTGIATGALGDYADFDAFKNAVFTQIKHILRASYEGLKRPPPPTHIDPFGSLFIESCVEKGVDALQGGGRHGPIRASGGFGLGTAADALTAVKKFVYDEKRLSLRELADALADDFAGHEALQSLLSAETPCYGNDDDEADAIAKELFETWAREVHSFNGGEVEGRFVTSLFSYTRHVRTGETIAALPNGRHAGEPISDTISPSQGKDRYGPTAMLNSVLKLDHEQVTGGYALNVKLTPSCVHGEAGEQAIIALIRTCFSRGGSQLQINFVDSSTLRAAQVEPQKHRNLVVRVAGFSEYFNCLDRNLQDEIISRTEHELS